MNKKDFSLGILSGVVISLSITYYLNKDLLIKSKKKKFKKRKKRKISNLKTIDNKKNQDEVKEIVNDVVNNVVNDEETELDNKNLDIINKTDINRPTSPNIKNELLKHINTYEKSLFGRLFRDY